jgi:hypothetical protein
MLESLSAGHRLLCQAQSSNHINMMEFSPEERGSRNAVIEDLVHQSFLVECMLCMMLLFLDLIKVLLPCHATA